MSDSGGWCFKCQAYGNAHDPERHGMGGPASPQPGGGARFVATTSGVKAHVASGPGAVITVCGRSFTRGWPDGGPTVQQVCTSCAGQYHILVRALDEYWDAVRRTTAR
jgi:hypothetical protein